MARHPRDAAASGMGSYGLHFLNDEWNDSISNSEVFTLRWNQSVDKFGSELGLFKVTYPKDGVVVYELVANLTDAMDTTSCPWRPAGLDEELYALWLTADQHAQRNWALSPPWIPKESGHGVSPWAAPFIIPVVCILVLYAICLTTCLVYRRRKKAKREKEDATRRQDAGRNDSADSATTAQTLAASDGGADKNGGWQFTTTPATTEITVGSIADQSALDGERTESDIPCTHDEWTIGIGL